MDHFYPGVYVQELPSGVHSIAGVATSIAAFVGYTKKGPDNAARQLFSFADFERVFGGLATDSELSYAVQQFFLNGGTQCFVVRVPRAGNVHAALTIGESGTPATAALVLRALSTGAWANNLVMTIDYDGLPATATGGFNLTITDVVSGAGENFPNLTTDTTQPNFVTTIVNDPHVGSQLIQVVTANAVLPACNGVVGTPLAAGALANLQQAGKSVGFTVTVGGKSYPVTLYAAADPRPGSLAQVLLGLGAKAARALQADYPGAQVTAKSVKSDVTKPQPDAVQVVFSLPGHWDALVEFAADGAVDVDAGATLGLTAPAINNVGTYWFGGSGPAGSYESAVTAGSDSGALPNGTALIGDELLFTGIYALDKVDLFNILCIPDVTRPAAGTPNQPDLDDTTVNAVYAAAMAYCLMRRAFLIVDPPPNVVDVASAVDWKTNRLVVHDRNGATYFPRLRLADPLNNMQLRTFAPCGVVAGLYARTDGDRGVWKAPAGTTATLTGVQKLVYVLNDTEQGALNPLGLDCFRSFPVYGIVSWGARTLVGSDAEASEWKYIPVRRLALFLEESLYRGLQWAVFEPNDEGLWSQIRLNVEGFLNTLYRQGAFQGATPAQAYFVRCDSTTTTQTDIDAGVVNIVVGFAPVKPAEFVVLQLQQIAGQTAT